MVWVRKSAHSCIAGVRCLKKSVVLYAFTTAGSGVWAKSISAAGSGRLVSSAAQVLMLDLNPVAARSVGVDCAAIRRAFRLACTCLGLQCTCLGVDKRKFCPDCGRAVLGRGGVSPWPVWKGEPYARCGPSYGRRGPSRWRFQSRSRPRLPSWPRRCVGR